MTRKRNGSANWGARIFGAGPAALSLAVELGQRGISTTLEAPRPFEPWKASYGTFEAFLPSHYSWAVRHRYERPFWVAADGVAHTLVQPYVRLDTDAFQAGLLRAASLNGVQIVEGSSLSAETAARSDVLVIDATGRSLEKVSASTRYQSAYGAWVRLAEKDWLGADQMLFMDLRAQDTSGPPSFLYAMPEGDLYFVQETNLVSCEPVSLDLLKQRLAQRLAGLGLHVQEWSREELCLIPMGGRPVFGGPRSIVFGARAGLTQPSSGYQLARTLKLSSELAEALASAPGGPEALAKLGRRVIWPWTERLKWRLFDYGAGLLANMTEPELSEFLRLFYGEPEYELTEFIDGRLPFGRVVKLMGRVYRRATPPLRRRLLSQAPQFLM